jgi:hypoxanthine phosphoribosyltransferase
VTPEPGRLIVTWSDVDQMCTELSGRLEHEPFDAILGIARGGLVPAALLAQELDTRDVLCAAVASYEGDQRGDRLRFLEFPPSEAFVDRRVLVVDDIWDSGRTVQLTCRRVEEAGGVPIVVVLHYKPNKSHFPSRKPDFWVRETDDWVVFPWERDT